MSRKIAIITGVILGTAHFAFVGIPFIQSNGEGVDILFFVVDFPLYMAAQIMYPRTVPSSVLFNLFWYVGLGTVMYSLMGYAIGLLISRIAMGDKR
jgi:hypothetical protein